MLPTRESGDHRVLIADCPFWATEDQVTHLAKLLEARGETERGVLPYLAAPSHSGKTACILVGFLNSVASSRKEKLPPRYGVLYPKSCTEKNLVTFFRQRLPNFRRGFTVDHFSIRERCVIFAHVKNSCPWSISSRAGSKTN